MISNLSFVSVRWWPIDYQGTRITFVITVIVLLCVRNDLALNAGHILRRRGMMWVVGGLR